MTSVIVSLKDWEPNRYQVTWPIKTRWSFFEVVLTRVTMFGCDCCRSDDFKAVTDSE